MYSYIIIPTTGEWEGSFIDYWLAWNSDSVYACPSVWLCDVCCEDDFWQEQCIGYRRQTWQKHWQLQHAGPNRLKDVPTIPRKLRKPVFFKSSTKLFYYSLVTNHSRWIYKNMIVYSMDGAVEHVHKWENAYLIDMSVCPTL